MPNTPNRVYRRRRLAVLGGLTAFITALAYLPLTLLAPIGPYTPSTIDFTTPETAAVELSWPSSSAVAIGAVGFPGVLASSGSADPLPIASITKVIGALVILEAHPLTLGESGPDIAFTETDVGYYWDYRAVLGSVEPVSAGLVLSEYQALQASLISSANNYARSLGVWAFGSDAGFVTATADWLDRNGLHDTTVMEPTGLDPANRSTASDLLELGKLALANPVVAEIVSMSSATLPVMGLIENSNKILGSVGVDGIKTGTLDEAGACLLFSTDVEVGTESITVVGVALGGATHASQYPEVVALIDSLRDDFHSVPITAEGESFGSYSTAWGQHADAVAEQRRDVVVWGETPVTASVSLHPVALAAAGTEVGELLVMAGSDSFSIPLVLDVELSDPGPLWRLSNPGRLAG
ncbi:D-alanyl-D-alanine carboxypeptidase (penicillin-binding protein 5/6) [Homoserinimonas aerilata]|uniref:D-alanyl-D-alanine carboxypeptidase (Penicillin-binding protein 5/6) n=1 Tax=Homoserinimonas aerilata TaxID=1162970 RepID=A0A542YJ04_9MICO|nr:D-alanyl-D-alanine carboxypeptidase [Homoserinimonas aerilata]TQL48059.1 D-alanyl-D-alanine carboxypeptidase (penicillin-binding protein 5/6) [Homoserinimonas aerilata]